MTDREKKNLSNNERNYSSHVVKNSSIPQPLRDLLTKLEFLSMIQEGQKPCMGDMTFVNAKSWFGAFKRNTHSENQKSLIVSIDQIIELAISFLKEFSGTEFHTLIVDTLSRARAGISTLCETYKNNHMTVASIRVCLSNIDLQLSNK